MSDDTEQQHDPVGDEVQWYRDPDGTEWFVEDDVRFELADDGFAYPVVGGTTDPAGAVPLEVVVDEQAAADGELADPSTADGSATVDEPEVDDTADTDTDIDIDIEDEDEDEAAGDHAQERSPFAPPGQADTDGDAPQPDWDPPTSDADETAAGETQQIPAVQLEERRASPPADGTRGEPLLAVHGLDAGYGALPVLHGVEMEVYPGETAVILGLNGAGKTTTVSTICGALEPWGGEIHYDGNDVAGWSTSKAVANGVVMVPEGRRVFPDLSVRRNLQVGAWARRDDDEWFDQQREVVFDYFPRLREREQQLAGTLSGGEQQMLAVGRGLMAGPRLLIIDEASMGLAPVIVKDVFDIIAQINADGVTVLMVEQNVGVLEVADIGYVMEQGHIAQVLEGEDLRDRSVVSAALMG